jgi:hypothetical protein
MKPDWDKLMDEFKDSKTSLVADVDCTAAGKDLCEKVGVSGYPTIKHGDPNDLKDYSGGRSFDDLKKFADENLGPVCGPNALELCDEDTKALIEGFQKMSPEELEKLVSEDEEKLTKAGAKYDKSVEKLEAQVKDAQARMEKETKAKEAALDKENKKLSLKIKKSVLSHKKKQEDSSKKKRKEKKDKKKAKKEDL